MNSPTPFHMPHARPLAALILAAALALSGRSAYATAAHTVQWSAAQVQASGLGITHLTPEAYRPSFRASATVQNPAALLHGWSALAVARAQLAEAQSARQLTQLQARRAQGLFQSGQNVALATVQQAQAQAQQAQAKVVAAKAAEQATQAALQASLGPALTVRLMHDAALRRSLADERERLVDLTLPPGVALPPDARIWLRLPGGDAKKHDGWLPAQLVGPAAAASAQVQGLRYVLLAPAASGLMPGLRLLARVDAGRARSGVLLPAASVVWSRGQAVVFVASPVGGGAQRLTPRAVSTAWPLQDGYAQPGWSALDVVTRGAGLVLTPPPAPHAHPATGGDDD